MASAVLLALGPLQPGSKRAAAGGLGPCPPHLGCCTFRPRDVDSLCAAIRALLYLVLHLLPLSQAAKPLRLDAALQDQEQMPGGKHLIMLISA